MIMKSSPVGLTGTRCFLNTANEVKPM